MIRPFSIDKYGMAVNSRNAIKSIDEPINIAA